MERHREHTYGSHYLEGKLLGFDEYMNLVLDDVETDG